MKHVLWLMSLALAAAAPAAFAQTWEVGAGTGGRFLTSDTVSNPTGNAAATRDVGVALSARLDNYFCSGIFGGELRFDHESGELKLSFGGTDFRFASQSNAVHYDLVYNLASSESTVPPFVLVGGVKWYSGTGTEQVHQPLFNIAVFSDVGDMPPPVSVGAGVKFRMAKSVMLGLSVDDYPTPFPSTLIAPVPPIRRTSKRCPPNTFGGGPTHLESKP
jgi:hypothetical protein